jgi:DNA-binding beta-propeller fold protein YncE
MTHRIPVRWTVPALSGAILLAAPLQAQLFVNPANEHPNPYETINDFFQLPDGRTWGATSAVYVDIDGTSIWVAERCGANSCAGSNVDPILKYDRDGRLLASFGAGMFIWPHGIHVDREGNVWVTDARSANAAELQQFPNERGKGHVVYKFSPQGQLLLTLGQRGEAGDGTGPLLNEPNDVLVAPNGDIYVADGHSGQGANANRNTVARIAKFDRNGNFLESWGRIGTAPGEFRTPHGLAMDSQGRLFVADRGNVRIQIFDQQGNFITEWKQFGRLSGIYIDANDILYTADSESSPTSNPGWRRGIRVGNAVTGHVLAFIPDPDLTPGGTSAAEGVTADRDGNIYGAEVGPRQLVRYVRRQ